MAGELRLKVVASTIDGQGIAKLDSDSFRKLKLTDGMPVFLTYGTKTLELAARQDTFYSESTVRLMRHDMEELRVVAGMEVSVAKNNDAPAKEEKKPAKGKGGRKSRKANAASLDRF